MHLKEWCHAHAATYQGALHFDEPLDRHTYYRIGGPADVFLAPSSLADLLWVSRLLEETQTPYMLLGAGSNVLFSDSGFRGLVLQTSKLNSTLQLDKTTLVLHTGASVMIPSVIRRAMQEGWTGLEFLCGIPGTMGGAVFMNAGTHLGEAQDRVLKVNAVALKGSEAGKIQTFALEGEKQLRFEYRKNLFLPRDALIWSIDWQIGLGPIEVIKKTLSDTLDRRKDTQPINFPSCGSVFKNPNAGSLKAWEVVNQLGLRGHRIGNAQISVKHSNFIVNLGGAKASDVIALIELIRSRARNELGIELEPEVRLVGEFQ